MAAFQAFDVVLLSWRDDMARAEGARVLARLPGVQRRPGDGQGSAMPLPRRVATMRDWTVAQHLAHALEACGAEVAVVPSSAEFGRTEPAGTRSPSQRPLTLLLLTLVVGAGWLWWQQPRTPQPRAFPALTLPAAPAAAPSGEMQPTEDARVARLNAEALQLAGEGRYEDAVARLRRALDLAPQQPVVRNNLQTVLLSWGAHEMNAGRPESAMAPLETANQLGARADVLRWLGVARLQQADVAGAIAALEQAASLAPRDADTLVALAEAYLKQDRRPQALEVLQRAQDAGVRRPRIDELVSQLGREVDAEWDHVALQSPHFRLSFADDEDPASVRLVLDVLEDAYDRVGAKFQYFPADRTSVVLYTGQDFHLVTQTPPWAGGAFDGRIKLPIGGLSGAEPGFVRLVRHEYAHSLIGQLAGPTCPTWLNEGLAMWAEEEVDGERAAWARAHAAEQAWFSFDDLRDGFTKLPADRIELAYAQSYLVVRALLDRYGAHKVPDFLRAVARTRDVERAFNEVYPGDLASWEERLARDFGG
jgi:Flp pilus assembly protein TadD